jgi:hypothetical protein
MPRPLPPIDELRRRFTYNKRDGLIRYARDTQRHKLRGEVASYRSGPLSRYSVVAWGNGNKFQAHRVAWALYFGVDPDGIIDHINGDAFDNRIANLRLCDTSRNGANRGRTRINTSGFKGVTKHTRSGKWQAQIGAFGKRYFLGLFDDPKDAHAAYAAAAIQHFGEFARAE